MKPLHHSPAESQNKSKDEKPSRPDLYLTENNANKVLEIIELEGFFQEKLKLDSPVEVNGEIEEWLKVFDEAVKKSIFTAVLRLSNDGLFDLKEMLLMNPLQICSLAFSISISKEIATLNEQTSPNHLIQLKTSLTKMTQNLINSLDSYMPSSQRRSHEYLVSQIQNYISYLELQKFKEDTDDCPFWFYSFVETDLVISSMKWKYVYGFEYLGSNTRLVLLPDWMNLYSHFMQNISFSNSSILIGPSGSFKTGLLKELSSIFGYKYIVIEDAGSASSIKTIADLLETAIFTRSWIILKNLDFYKYELVSLVNYYVTLSKRTFAVQNDASLNSEVVTISGIRINISAEKLQPIFATSTASSMENFSALHQQFRLFFRPFSTSIPSLDILAYTRLLSSGFKDSLSLSDKLNCILRSVAVVIGWCNYKIGMRLIMKILETAATERLKNHFKGNAEGQALAFAIFNCLSPILSGSEQSVLKDILKVAFPEVQLNTETFSDNHWMKDSIGKMNLSFVFPYVEKLDALFEALEYSQLVIILGDHFSGKTSGVKVLQGAISECRKSILPPLSLYEYYVGTLSFNELVGQNNDGVCVQGMIATAITLACTEARKIEKMVERIPETKRDYVHGQVGINWILFHGEMQPDVYDYITYLVYNDISRSDSQWKLSPHSRLLFEVNGLESVSPSFVTNVPLIYFGSNIEPYHIFQHALGISLPSFVEGQESLLDLIFYNLIIPAISFTDGKGVGIVHNLKALVRNMANLFTSLLNDCGSKSYDHFVTGEQKIYLISQALLSIIWTFGMVMNRLDSTFNNFCRSELFLKGVNEIEKLSDSCSFECIKIFPEDGTVFDYFFESRLWCWKRWDDLAPKNNILSKQDISPDGQIIFTSEFVRFSYFSRVLLEKNHRFVISGGPGIGKSTLVNSCLRKDNFPSYKNKIQCNLDSSYNSEKFRGFVLKFYKDNEHQLDQSCLQNQRLILFVDDMEAVAAHDGNCAEFFSLLKMFSETSKWPTDAPLNHKNVSGMAVCAAICLSSVKKNSRLAKISNIFHYFEMDYSIERLEHIVNAILHPALK